MPAVLVTVLAWIARYLVMKLITAFGIALVSGGVSTYVLMQFKNFILSAVNSMSPEVYSILIMGGLGTAMSILFGAIAFKISLNIGKRVFFGVTGFGV